MYAQFSWVFCRFTALVFKTNRAQKIDFNFLFLHTDNKQKEKLGSFRQSIGVLAPIFHAIMLENQSQFREHPIPRGTLFSKVGFNQ